jgi:hypothetical protein
MVRLGGGGQATESAVDIGLEWLAKHQEANGQWIPKKYQASKGQTDTACTSLALLAFLGAGHTEKVGRYKDNVRRAIAWLKSVQTEEGCVYQKGDFDALHPGGPGYSHAMAGMALAEAAGMARVSDTIRAAQKAVDYSCQIHGHGTLEGDDYGKGKGAWRYMPGMEPDTSVTGWYIMQLKSAKVSGMQVPNASFKRAIEWLDKVMEKAAEDEGYGPAYRYIYQRGKYEKYTGLFKEYRLTAIGCLGRQFTGTPKDQLEGTVSHFMKVGGVPGQGNWDLYYWYYATLCIFQQGGPLWKKWNEGMKAVLLGAQRKGGDEDGSWDPQGDFNEYWGRVGQTALSILCLEVYYRYLPMYRH